MTDAADLLVWIDTETTGLNPVTAKILEVGLTVTDLDLVPIASFEMVVGWFGLTYENMYVQDMHMGSGLHDEVLNSPNTLGSVEDEALRFLTSTVGIPQSAAPMCGSSVQFDRLMLEKHMPRLHDYFHYRNIDVSSIKETCRRYNPGVYASLDKLTAPAKLHRVLPDLGDTLNEYQFYLDNFLHVDPEVLPA